MRLSDRLSQREAMRFAIEVENFSVAPPIHRRFELAFNFVLTEVFVKYVVEKFLGNRMIMFGMENAIDLLQNYNVFKGGLTKKNFAG